MPHFTFEYARGLASKSAFLEGHFPGNPVVPGAVILGCIAARLRGEGMTITEVGRMKFMRPLLPDMPFRLEIRADGDEARCSVEGADGVFAKAHLVIRSTHG